MPICSYIVYPDAGKTAEVRLQLERIEGCIVYPADTHELLLLITETSDETDERLLQQRLKEQPNIQCMAMTFANGEELSDEDERLDSTSAKETL